MVADIEELENLDASENSCSKRSVRRKSQRRKRVNLTYPRSKMEQSNCLEEIRFPENPPQSRVALHEAQSTTMIFQESPKGLNH